MGHNPIVRTPPMTAWSEVGLLDCIDRNRFATRWWSTRWWFRPDLERRERAHLACLILIRRRQVDLGLLVEDDLPGPVDVTAPPKRADARRSAVPERTNPSQHLGHGSRVVQPKNGRCEGCGVVEGRKHRAGCPEENLTYGAYTAARFYADRLHAEDRIDVGPELR